METALLAMIVIGGSMLLASAGLLLIKLKYKNRGNKHNELGGYILSILGTLYAVTLGFVVVHVSDGVEQQSMVISAETNALLNIYRYSSALAPSLEENVRLSCLAYSGAVAEKEWGLMPRGILCSETWTAMDDIWKSIKAVHPESQQEQAIFSLMLENYNNLETARRSRLMAAASHVSPVLWSVIISGACILVIFTYFFGSPSLIVQIAMTAMLSATLGLNVFLIMVDGSPFTGSFKIKPKPFLIARYILDHKGAMPSNGQMKLEK